MERHFWGKNVFSGKPLNLQRKVEKILRVQKQRECELI
jgi:hypothetical protein